MANPVKVKKSGATFQGLQIMTDAEMDYTVDVVLRLFANTNSGLGTVNIDGATGTSIGTFVDTSRSGSVGDHPVADSPTTVTTYTFKQDITSSATEVITRPIEYSSSGIRQQDDTALNNSIITRILNTCAASGIGSYALQPTAPSGTWTSIGTITNSVIGATNTTTLWRKTGDTAPTTVRPLKYQTSPSKSFKEMTDVEIQGLTNRFRNRIISTGICTYKLQTSAPTPGTWTTRGAAFNDTRNTLASQSYTGSYTGSYGATYSRSFAGSYSATYSQSFVGSYSATYSQSFTGSYSGTYVGAYAGAYTRFRSQNFQAFFAGFGAGVFTGFFTGFYTGFYTGYYTGSYTGSYTGNFAGTYTGNYTGNFAGTYAGSYAGSYAGTTIQASADTISTVSLWVRTA